MPQIVLALGADAHGNGNVTNFYTGGSYVDAKVAVDAAGQAGTISLGYVYSDPPPVETLRYGPRTGTGNGLVPEWHFTDRSEQQSNIDFGGKPPPGLDEMPERTAI